MEKSIFKYILRYSAPQQIYLLCVILAFYPFLFVSLDLPKIIVNRAIKPNADGDIFEAPIFGINRIARSPPSNSQVQGMRCRNGLPVPARGTGVSCLVGC